MLENPNIDGRGSICCFWFLKLRINLNKLNWFYQKDFIGTMKAKQRKIIIQFFSWKYIYLHYKNIDSNKWKWGWIQWWWMLGVGSSQLFFPSAALSSSCHMPRGKYCIHLHSSWLSHQEKTHLILITIMILMKIFPPYLFL